MSFVSVMLYLFGILAAGLFAIGMDPYSCGLPLLLVSAAVIVGSWNRKNRTHPGLVCWFVIIVVGYFGWRMATSPLADFGRSDALLLCGAFLSFWWTTTGGNSGKFTILLFGLWLMALANVGVAAYQAYVDVDFFPIYGKRATVDFPSGFYHHYNHFANFMLGVGLLSFGYAMAGTTRRSVRLAGFGMYLVCLFGIFLATSRGGWLAMGCGSALVFVGWLSDLWRRKVSWAGGALVVATVLAPLLITGAWHLGSKAVAHRNGGDSGRLEFASMALELIAEKPVTGGGSRSFFFDSMKKWNVAEMYVGSGDIQYVHNEYLQAAVDYGLIGLGLLLLLFGLVMFRGVAYVTMSGKEAGGDAGLALGAMAALCGMGVQAFFSFVYHVLPDIMLMGCCVGLLANQAWPLAKKTVSEHSPNKLPWARGLVASLLGMAVACFAWRDALAWLTLRPGFDFSKPPEEEQVARLQAALLVRPDFRVMSELSKLLVKMNQDDDQLAETKHKRLETAIAVQQAAVKRAPNSYHDILNLALMYDSDGQYEEAEPLFDSIVDDLDARERYYGARFHYSRHLVARANQVWHRREPEKALVLFLRAKEQLAKTIAGYEGGDVGALSQSIESSIAFLEGANIKPLPGDQN